MKLTEALVIGVVVIAATAVSIFGHGLQTEALLGIYGTALGYAGGRVVSPKMGP